MPFNLKDQATDPKVLMADKAANWLITVGGLSVIAAVLGIFVFILLTVLPLFVGSSSKLERQFALKAQAPAKAGLLDEHNEKAVLFFADGKAGFLDLASQALEAAPAPGVAVSAADISDYSGAVALGLANGKVWLAEAGFDTRFDGDIRVKTPFVKHAGPLDLGLKQAPALVRGAGKDGSQWVAAAKGPHEVAAALAEFDGKRWKAKAAVLPIPAYEGAVSALLIHTQGRILVGTDKGWLFDYRLEDGKPALYQKLEALHDGEGISALAYTIGEQSVVVGGLRGSVISLTLLEKGEASEYMRIHEFQPLGTKVLGFTASTRDRTFVARGSDRARAYFLTAERTLFDVPLPAGFSPELVRLSTKGDGLLALDSRGPAAFFSVKNPHPEVTAKTLFGKIWYEGYEQPDYVWQSTGGSDDFEAKFSLTPLIYGTIKGTFYALLFAVPLAIFGAVYTSQFMSRQLRSVVKPVIELMAALPSVVLGFLAALLLAPMIEKNLFTIFLGLLALPVAAVLTLFAWRALPKRVTRKVPEEAELGVLLGGLLLAGAVLAFIGPALESLLFNDFKLWMSNQLGISYDQRNSLVVGFAMGFAVIPIIFTICEDALSSVPKHLTSASLSAGATPWQTAILVVLPVALSGIFSAVMVGFGRAIGETMIVLMATGNTAVMEFSPFNGFRALSANIAVEIPEAPVDGSLYRVLFFAGLLLFLVTFAVNTVAELIRLHLRRKYSQL